MTTVIKSSAATGGDALDQRDAIYEVGYGKPPVATRFGKGRSGNPKGRPRGSKSAHALLDQALAAPVTINEGGRTRVVEQRTALFKSLVAKAIKGDARAAALVVRLMDRLQTGAPVEAHQQVTHIVRTIVDPRRTDRLELKPTGERP